MTSSTGLTTVRRNQLVKNDRTSRLLTYDGMVFVKPDRPGLVVSIFGSVYVCHVYVSKSHLWR